METFSLIFYLRKTKIRKDGTAPIYLRITVNGQRTELSTKRFLPPDFWDEQRGIPVRRKGKEKELNAFLEAIRAKVYRHYRDLINREEAITAQGLKDAYLGKTAQRGKSVLEVFDFHLHRVGELVGTEYAAATYTRFQTTRKHLNSFLVDAKHPLDFRVQRITLAFLNDFDHYLRTVKGIGNNSTVKYLSIFRRVLNVAIEHGWLEKNPFHGYKGRTRVVDREYLTEEELERIAAKQFLVPRLTQIRDIFLFSCYTGLAYSDVGKLTADHVFRGVDGQYWININRTKTDTKSMIPILPPAMAILEHYEDSVEAQAKGLLLPVKSNQKMNAYLKEIADLCGIEKKLTFHMARHTFATTVTLSNGVPIESVSAMLGHKDIKTTQHYAKIVQRKVGEDMQALRDKLFSGTTSSETGKLRKLS